MRLKPTLLLILSTAFMPLIGHSATQDTARVVINYQMRGPQIHPEYAGLSFERQTLLPNADGSRYFDTHDTALVNIFRSTGIHSIRIGGNSLEKKGAIAPTNEDLDYLFRFAKAIGAKVIYSFPLDSAHVADDARQAKYIWDNYREELNSFAVGNEPGKRKDYQRFYRPTWRCISNAVLKVAPEAKFIGPDDNPNPLLSNMMWQDFGPKVGGPLTCLSLHSYPIGCAFINVGKEKDPRKFIKLDSRLGCDSMLSSRVHQTYSHIYDEMQPIYSRAPYRLSETSNYWYGGLEGSSNAYATALWAVDYMYWWAWRGNFGVNFHSGDRVGAESRAAWYTAFAHGDKGIDVRPLSYALRLFDATARGSLVPIDFTTTHPLLSAYATSSEDGFIYLTIINRHHTTVSSEPVEICLSDVSKSVFSAATLTMKQKDDNIYSTGGITIGGDSIRTDGTLPAMRWTPIDVNGEQIILNVPSASVVVLKLNVYNTYETDTRNEPVQSGKFKGTWQSLSKYEVPEWFRDAKFGIWAHWGPQSVPEYGDWYAYYMYKQGSRENKYHLAHYGHPSVVGFKDLINMWRPANWQPDELVKLYKRAGAKYFVAMANHHDNFDNWDSKYHTWKATKEGPKRNILAGWEQAAKANGLRFGISVHASRAWNWYDMSETSDKTGSLKGVPYDGVQTAKEGKGKWWDGLDPQELYARGHHVSGSGYTDSKGVETDIPDSAWCGNYYDRTMDVINQTKPDLVYFDDTSLPLWPVSDAGLQIAAHYYNRNILWHNGNEEGVITAKGLTPFEQQCLVRDVERGALDHLSDRPWQTCTCLGSWHYDRTRYTKNTYKTAVRVVRMLADIVSKNGNLLLSVPVRADGSIDDREEAILDSMATWMNTNSECIFSTRPWNKFGEGPDAENAKPLADKMGFNESNKAYTSRDMRFTTKGNVLYAILMKRPDDGHAVVKSLAGQKDKIKKVEVLGQKRTRYTCDSEGLKVEINTNINFVPVLKITFKTGKTL